MNGSEAERGESGAGSGPSQPRWARVCEESKSFMFSSESGVAVCNNGMKRGVDSCDDPDRKEARIAEGEKKYEISVLIPGIHSHIKVN